MLAAARMCPSSTKAPGCRLLPRTHTHTDCIMHRQAMHTATGLLVAEKNRLNGGCHGRCKVAGARCLNIASLPAAPLASSLQPELPRVPHHATDSPHDCLHNDTSSNEEAAAALSAAGQPHSMEPVGHTKRQLHTGCLRPCGRVQHHHEATTLRIYAGCHHDTVLLCSAARARDEQRLPCKGQRRKHDKQQQQHQQEHVHRQTQTRSPGPQQGPVLRRCVPLPLPTKSQPLLLVPLPAACEPMSHTGDQQLGRSCTITHPLLRLVCAMSAPRLSAGPPC